MSDVEPSRVLWEETIPGGAYWTRIIRRHTTLRIVDLAGSRGVSCLCYNADDPVERYNAADTVKIQNTIFLTTGRVLFSDMGRVLFSITADTSGHHDTLGGGSTPETNRARYGDGDYQRLRNDRHRDARTNFLYALGRHGLGARDVMPNLNFFTRVRVATEGGLEWVPGCEKPGAFIDLRAEMHVLVALSNTPHPLCPSPTYDPQPIRLVVWQSPPPASDDRCRTSSEEARRGFRNTDALFE
jgi:urea carboxylase-associated protein 2